MSIDQNNGLTNEQSPLPSPRKKESNKKLWINLITIFLSISLWGAIVFFGYTYAKDYIDTSIGHVQQENSINVQQLTAEVQSLKQEVTNLTESIISTGTTLSSSTSIQDRIDARLETLDKNLKELENSLKVLKEAPRGQN